MLTRFNLMLLFACALLACSKSRTSPAEQKPVAQVYPRGIPIGVVSTKTIGPAGGSMQSPDARITISVPAGAVTANTDFTITPISSTLPMSSGYSYRLGPENVQFAKPVEISMPYTDEDTDGSSAEMLYLAYQGQDGYWTGLLGTTLDKTNHMLKVNTKHFSDWGKFRRFILYIDQPRLEAGEKTNIRLEIEDHEPPSGNDNDDLLAPVKIVAPKEYKADQNITGWKVIGPGTLKELKKYEVEYTAPATIPSPTQAYVEVGLKNVVNSQHPDRAGTSGQVIARTTLKLGSAEFNLYINGAKMNVPVNAVTINGGQIHIDGADVNLDKSIDIFVNATVPGTYAYGNSTQGGKAYIRSSYIGTRPGHITQKADCTTGRTVYSEGGVTITEVGALKEIVAGSFTATIWWQDLSSPGECRYTSQEIHGDFRLRRE